MNNKWLSIVLVVVLAAATITNGVLYFQASGKLTEARSQIESLQADVSTLDGDVLAVEGNVSNLNGSVSTLVNGVSGLQGDVSGLKGDLSGLKGDVSGLHGDLSGVQGQVFGIEQDVNTAQNDITKLNGNYSTLENDLSAVESNVSTVSSEINALSDEVSSIEDNIVDISEVAAIIKPAIVRINTDLGTGSGVIITGDGWVLTAGHVLQDATTISITLTNGAMYNGVDVYFNNTLDVGLVKIDSSKTDFTAAILGSSSDTRVGEQVLAVGYPLGLDGAPSYSIGIVSAFRIAEDFDGNEYIQTDAAINGGNSGGPLINMKGEVIGIVSWGYEWDIDDQGYVYEIFEGMSFAVPVDGIFPLPNVIVMP